MCSADEQIILDSYVEGVFETNSLIALIEKKSKVISGEIYRGISVPKFVLKLGNNINQYFDKGVMSFSKSIDVATRFSNKNFVEGFIFTSLKKDGYDLDYIYDINDNEFFTKVIIRMKNVKSLDIYEDYANKVYENEKEVLVMTTPLYINSISSIDDSIIIDCVDEVEYSDIFMVCI